MTDVLADHQDVPALSDAQKRSIRWERALRDTWIYYLPDSAQSSSAGQPRPPASHRGTARHGSKGCCWH